MLTSKTIPSKPDRLHSQDFTALRQEALAWLKSWCHETWTDFNESDPGVTLLEELCYALTDLGLRAERPILDLLNLPDGPSGESPWRANSFYRPDQLFPMEPLTAEDYRKLILDECLDVLEVQCVPILAAPDGLGPFPGSYAVSVLFDPDLVSESAADASSTETRLSQIKHLLGCHRNLGERFQQVVAIPVVRFSLHGRFRLQSGRQPSEVVADAYMAVREALLPAVQHRSYKDLEVERASLSEVLTGPFLLHGEISPPSGTLVLPWDEVRQRTLDALNRVPGLVDFDVEFARLESPLTNAVSMLASEFALAGEATGPEQNSVTLEPAAPEPGLAARIAKLIHSRVRTSGRQLKASLARSSSWEHGGESLPGLDVQTFEPIGNGLPSIYGIGPGGKFDAAEPLRRGRSKQLQGFFLVFEQLAADLAAQLAHVRDLFSNRPQKTSYFSQPLYHVPGIFPLLKGFPADQGESSAADRHAREAAYQENSANPYRQGLQSLSETPERFRRRRAQFLDHLLARFGESYPLRDPANQETNANKEQLLRHIDSLGSNRATARAIQPMSNPGRSGLERRVELLLRRDDASNALIPAEALTNEARATAPTHAFYFLIEHLLFLPTEPPSQASSGTTSDTARPTRIFDLDLFRSRLTHVLLNWTVMPLSPEVRHFAEELIRAQVGAHLESRFLWFERAEFSNLLPETTGQIAYRELAGLHDQWVAAGSPPLKLAATADTTKLTVYSDDVAAQLSALLSQPEEAGRVWPEA